MNSPVVAAAFLSRPEEAAAGGFTVTWHPIPARPATASSTAAALAASGMELSATGVERFVTERGHVALVDGYALNASAEALVAALEAGDENFLSSVNGHFCALIIRPDMSASGFCDRLGVRTLYWHTSDRTGITVSSRWENMPVYHRQPDKKGLSEVLRYRSLSGRRTSFAGISQLPRGHRVSFEADGATSVVSLGQEPAWPVVSPSGTYAEKLAETRMALGNAIDEVAKTHDKAAIFLSSGVDSSLLAGLAKSRFRKCLLVTTVFPGEANPELATAQAFARALDLEHLLVQFDVSRIERDLKFLIRAKGGQVNFHAFAMHQMIAAIPDDYRLLLYGEAADTLFGYAGYRHTHALLRCKTLIDRMPAAARMALSLLPFERARKLCKLGHEAFTNVALQPTRINYPPEAMAVIRSVCGVEPDEFYAHQAVERFRSTLGGAADLLAFRSLLQDVELHSAVPNHCKEAELSAAHFGKRIFTPFLCRAVMGVAKTLGNDLYFGRRYAKPILRDLACEYYDRKLIYREKYGYEVPFLSWLEGPLAHLVAAVKQERTLFDGRLLRHLDLHEHYPLFWSLINWQLVYRQAARSRTPAPRSPRSTVRPVA